MDTEMSEQEWPPATAVPGTRARAGLLVPAGLILLSVLASAGWGILLQWYALIENYDTPHFAFDKIAGHFASPILRSTLLLFVVLSLIYIAGSWLLHRAASITPAIKVAIVLSFLGPGLINVLLYPVGALDVFNYLLHLKLFYHFNENPYVMTFAPFLPDPFAQSAFFAHETLFYGPVWLLFSGLPSIMTGFDDVVRLLIALKIFNLVLLALTALAIHRHQQHARQGWLAVYLFLANPLILFEGVANAHNDVMVAIFLVAAVVAFKRGSWLVAPWLTLSVLVKFFAAAVLPLFGLAMLLTRWSTRTMLISGLVALAVAILTVAPFWAEGQMLEGLTRATIASQNMNHVSISSLVQQFLHERQAPAEVLALVRPAFIGLFSVAALAIMGACWRGRAFERSVVDTFLLFSLLLTLLYPWYLIPALAVLVLRYDGLSLGFLFLISALGLIYYPLAVWAWFNSGFSPFQIHLFLALFLTLPIAAFLVLEAARWLGLPPTSSPRATTHRTAPGGGAPAD